MKPLLLSHEETVAALQKVAKAQLSAPSRIRVRPLEEYFQAAVNYLTGHQVLRYDRFVHEWALIINTNGDVYAHGDSYLPEGWMGNVFKQSLAQILTSTAHTSATNLRMQRAETCRQCKFDQKCDQLAIVESIPSERSYSATGKLLCPVAQPMIQFMVDEIQRSPHAQALLNLYQNQESCLPQLVPA